MANYLVTDAQLQAIANKIRQKTGGSAAIQFYSAFVSEIEKLTDTRDANASASDILNGKTAYVNKNKVTGNIPSKGSNDVTVSGNTVSVPTGHYPSAVQKTVGTAKAAATYNTSILDQTIAAGQYLSGAQTIKGVKTENIDAGNIKPGVRIRVGDANNAGRIKDVTGMMPEIGNTTINTDTYDSVLQPGSYVSGIVTIKGVTTQNIDAGNIKYGVNVKVGDANNAGRIKDVTGTYKPGYSTREVSKTIPASNTSVGWSTVTLGSVTLNAGERVKKVSLSFNNLLVSVFAEISYNATSDTQTVYVYAVNQSSDSKTVTANTISVTVYADSISY